MKTCQSMQTGRWAFGMCSIGNLIYVVGGRHGFCYGVSTYNFINTCETYDVLADKWNYLPSSANLPQMLCGMAVEAFNKRFLYAFGGVNDFGQTLLDYDKEMFMRLDTYCLSKGWETVVLKNPSLINGCFYGVIPLGGVT